MRYENSYTKAKGDLSGQLSFTFKEGKSLQDYCRKHIENYDAERLEAFTVRLFYGEETCVTIYAVDKTRTDDELSGELPVKKFKLPLTFLKDILAYLDSANVTLTTGDYDLERIRVINA